MSSEWSCLSIRTTAECRLIYRMQSSCMCGGADWRKYYHSQLSLATFLKLAALSPLVAQFRMCGITAQEGCILPYAFWTQPRMNTKGSRRENLTVTLRIFPVTTITANFRTKLELMLPLQPVLVTDLTAIMKFPVVITGSDQLTSSYKRLCCRERYRIGKSECDLILGFDRISDLGFRPKYLV